MRLMQVRKGRGGRRVVATDEGGSWFVEGFATVYDLALAAIAQAARRSRSWSRDAKRGAKADPAGAACRRARSLAPIDHPDPAHLIVTGTGLTHLGSAATRDAMHQKVAEAAEETLTDSMKMFRMGLEGGKPKRGQGRASSRSGSTRATAPSSPAPARRSSRRPSPRTAARSRRSPASTSSARTGRRSASASRSSTNSPTTSPSGRTTSGSPIRSSGRARSGRRSCSATCRRTFAAPRASAAARRSSSSSRS